MFHIQAQRSRKCNKEMKLSTFGSCICFFLFIFIWTEQTEPFQKPVSLEQHPDYAEYIFHPMDLCTLEKVTLFVFHYFAHENGKNRMHTGICKKNLTKCDIWKTEMFKWARETWKHIKPYYVAQTYRQTWTQVRLQKTLMCIYKIEQQTTLLSGKVKHCL